VSQARSVNVCRAVTAADPPGHHRAAVVCHTHLVCVRFSCAVLRTSTEAGPYFHFSVHGLHPTNRVRLTSWADGRGQSNPPALGWLRGGPALNPDSRFQTESDPRSIQTAVCLDVEQDVLMA
jgi:hypothetical protein